METPSFRLDGSWGPVHGAAPARVLTWTEGDPGDPFELLQAAVRRDDYRIAVGYLGYDLGRQVERIEDRAHDRLEIPDLWVGFWDHVADGPAIGEERSDPGPLPVAAGPPRPTLPRARYLEAVRSLRERLAAGDLYQANLTQRITVPLEAGGDPQTLYETLLTPHPSAFACYLDCGSFQIVGASPERFLAFDPATRLLRTEPIKGTAPAGRLAELLASDKDRAEHVMIVDLERNDLGRVCEPGTVRVQGMLRSMDLPGLHHLVTTVEGRTRIGIGLADMLRATFPGGSITGAPKVAAMQLIEELEPVRRGVYCGAVGWFRPDGAFDLGLAIRTAVVRNDELHVHAGGGVVMDSTPEGEHDECWLKARRFLEAVGASVDHSSRERSAHQVPPPS
jgi:anthranilate/para-aminobenzoate synthase component I